MSDLVRFGIKARGGKELKAHREGKRLTQRQAIYAKCFDCMGGYSDGKMDCLIPSCSLYQWMPYKGKKVVDAVDASWCPLNPFWG